ncbi:hypothetical protein MUK51_07290 [Sphingobacterium faecium]|uniref:hypothetical protein n=1 Tax=Sphingobacterium faecium TaxID=34087 RepID=UPI0021B534B4|nr:hypothetical protein [Sphingobacterium faecium]UXD71089.1 hypothetical protein MUK51_07290 [Sphingobacterium faecium]
MILMDTMPTYFTSIAIPIVAAFLGLSYPLILQAVIRLDDKYPGLNITSHFKKNWAYVSFDRVGVSLFVFIICFIALKIFQESLGFDNELLKHIVHYSHVLLTIFIFIQIALLFYTIRAILIYSDSKNFVEYLIKEKGTDPMLFIGLGRNFIKSDNQELFSNINTTFIKRAYSGDEQFAEQLVNYHSAIVFTLNNYDFHDFEIVKKNIYMFSPILGDGSKNISNQEYSMIWYALKLLVKKNDLKTFKTYWSYVVQYVHIDLKNASPSELNFTKRNTVNLKDWNDRKFDLVFFHFLLCSFLKYKKLEVWLEYIKDYKPNGFSFPKEQSFINNITLPEICLLFNYFMIYDRNINNKPIDLTFPFEDQYDHVSADIGYRATLSYFQNYLADNYRVLRKGFNFYILENIDTYESLNDKSYRHLLLKNLNDADSYDFEEQATKWKGKYVAIVGKVPLNEDYLNEITKNIKAEINKIKEDFSLHLAPLEIKNFKKYYTKNCEYNFDKSDLLSIGPSFMGLDSILSGKFRNEFSRYFNSFLGSLNLPIYNFRWKDFINVLNLKIGKFKYEYVIYVHRLNTDLNIDKDLLKAGYNVIVLNNINIPFLESGLIVVNKNWLALNFIKPHLNGHILKKNSINSDVKGEVEIDDNLGLIYRQLTNGQQMISSIDNIKVWIALIYRLEFKVNMFCSGFVLQNYELLWQGEKLNNVDDVVF